MLKSSAHISGPCDSEENKSSILFIKLVVNFVVNLFLTNFIQELWLKENSYINIPECLKALHVEGKSFFHFGIKSDFGPFWPLCGLS